MSDAVPPPDAAAASKADPAELTLRGQPRAVTRLNRRVLMVLAGALILFVFGATMLALDPPSFRGGEGGQELYNVRNKPTAEGLGRPAAQLCRRPAEARSAPAWRLGRCSRQDRGRFGSDATGAKIRGAGPAVPAEPRRRCAPRGAHPAGPPEPGREGVRRLFQGIRPAAGAASDAGIKHLSARGPLAFRA